MSNNEHFIDSSKNVISSVTIPKPAKRVVYNNGEPGMYWTSEETLHLSSKFQQTLIGKCAYGKPSLGVIHEFITTIWMPKGEFFVGILDPRHILIRFSLYEDYVKTWLKDATYIEGFLF